MIKIENLVKAFGSKRAVDGISFSVERGEVVGFLGPNGSGKSTTMRMITGYYAPTPRHGSPDDLRTFVERLHENGVGVTNSRNE